MVLAICMRIWMEYNKKGCVLNSVVNEVYGKMA